MKNLKRLLRDEQLCIGKIDEADECKTCNGYEYRRSCYFPFGKRSDLKEGEIKDAKRESEA